MSNGNRLVTESEAKLITDFRVMLVLWTVALAAEFNCCAEHTAMATMKVKNILDRFGLAVAQYGDYHITTEQMEYLIKALINEMSTEEKTLRGLKQLDDAMKTSLVQKEARA